MLLPLLRCCCCLRWRWLSSQCTGLMYTAMTTTTTTATATAALVAATEQHAQQLVSSQGPPPPLFTWPCSVNGGCPLSTRPVSNTAISVMVTTDTPIAVDLLVCRGGIWGAGWLTAHPVWRSVLCAHTAAYHTGAVLHPAEV